jgi:hypothetical protein
MTVPKLHKFPIPSHTSSSQLSPLASEEADFYISRDKFQSIAFLLAVRIFIIYSLLQIGFRIIHFILSINLMRHLNPLPYTKFALDIAL